MAIATLASDRALLLVGDPGTAKSWLSEHLAAAISGTSRYVVQGTAGATEDQIKYSWNYALVLKDAACLIEYLETVGKSRGGAWSKLYEARRFIPVT